MKVRNPKNNPSSDELVQLQASQKQAATGKKLKTVVKQMNNQTMAFFAPFHIMPLCQKCHGEIGNTLLEKDHQVIQEYYPNDKAIGYASGDLRGMWSISFKK